MPDGVADVRAEMVATVASVLVADGDSVAEGDTLVVLESMKMEIPVLAEQAGTVQDLVASGATVQAGDVLATIR